MATMVKHQGMISVENGPVWRGNIPIPLDAWEKGFGYFNWSWTTQKEEVSLWAMSKSGNLTLICVIEKQRLRDLVETAGPDDLRAFLADW